MTFRRGLVFAFTLAVSVLLTSLIVSYRRERSLRMGNDLIEASWAGDIGKMRELIESGADVNFHLTAHPSCIPLTCAAQQGHIDAVRLLLGNKVDVNAADDSHKTALEWAKEKNHNEIVGLLRQAGARE